jgi:hypothetical protein
MKTIKIISIYLSFIVINFAQTCGFGCLGLSGVFAGYSQLEYSPNGLNKYVLANYSNDHIQNYFGMAKGIKVGGNIFRANFDSYFITAKGYYQFAQEENVFRPKDYELMSVNLEKNLKYQFNHWGVGVDFGIPIFSFIDLKIIDGGVTFMQHRLTISDNNQIETDIKEVFENKNNKIGYYIGSGLILKLISNYLSVEGTVFYNSFNVDNLYNENNQALLSPTLGTEKFVTKGGFSASLQINLGLPL